MCGAVDTAAQLVEATARFGCCVAGLGVEFIAEAVSGMYGR